MSGIAKTPKPPYYAVMFASQLAADNDGYADMAREMADLAAAQPGFLGMESARENGGGITICYWRGLRDIQRWKENAAHLQAQKLGREKWYAAYAVRIAKVEREYGL